MFPALKIGKFRPDDEPGLFAAFAATVAAGGAFPRRPPADVGMFRAAWLTGMTTVQVARANERVAGSYFLRPAFPDAAAHIANAGYLVAEDLRGRGYGRALAEHSLHEAQRRGFTAMLFTLVLERGAASGSPRSGAYRTRSSARPRSCTGVN